MLLKQYLVVGGILFLSLFGEYLMAIQIGAAWLQQNRDDFSFLIQSEAVQWLIILTILFYGLALVYLRRKNTPLSDLFFSLGLLIIPTAFYLWNYPETAKSMDAIVWAFGLVLGQALAWWRDSSLNRHWLICEAWVLTIICLLGLVSLWQPEIFQLFRYRGQLRWAGAWNNPNTYGLLMAVALILSMTRQVYALFFLQEGKQKDTSLMKLLTSLLLWLAIVVISIGLFKSFSRGAWLGMLCGLLYLIFSLRDVAPMRKLVNLFFQKKRSFYLPVMVFFLFLFIFLYWNYRYTEHSLMGRLFSVGNNNDFSWKNRVATYEGAIQMMRDNLWHGFGWDQVVSNYHNLYMPDRIDKGAVIALNAYLLMGTTCGVPVCLCFAGYFFLKMRNVHRRAVHRDTGRKNRTSYEGWSSLGCRSAAIVLAVGFWFDGGLFKMALAVPFWVLIELGCVASAAQVQYSGFEEQSLPSKGKK